MPFLWSDDVTTGNRYDGQWLLLGDGVGPLTLAMHHVADGNVPWIFAGADNLLLLETDFGDNIVNVTFTAQSSAKDDVATATQLVTDFNAALVNVTCTGGLYVAATDVIELTFDTPVEFRWDNASSTAGSVFDRTSGETPNTLQALSMRYVDERPDVMLINMSNGPDMVSPGTTGAKTIALPLADGRITPEITFSTSAAIDISWYRVNVPDVVCPITLQWFLWFL